MVQQKLGANCFGNITEFMLISSWPLTQNSDGRNSHISNFAISYTFQQKMLGISRLIFCCLTWRLIGLNTVLQMDI